MRKKLPFGLIVFLFLFSSTAHAEVLAEFSDKSLPVLNEELRSIKKKIDSVENSITTYTPTASNALPGSVVQVVNAQYNSADTTSDVIPVDGSIPQQGGTEGKQFMSATVTPSSASNKLLIRAVIFCKSGSAGGVVAALFQDSTVNALAASGTAFDADSGYPVHMVLEYFMTAGTVSSTTFKVRCSSTPSGTFTFCPTSIFGIAAISTLTVTEIKG